MSRALSPNNSIFLSARRSQTRKQQFLYESKALQRQNYPSPNELLNKNQISAIAKKMPSRIF